MNKFKFEYFFFLLILFLINGCSKNKEQSGTKRNFIDEKIGQFEFYLPDVFDTNTISIHISDHPYGDRIRYIWCKKENLNLFPDTTYEFLPYSLYDDSLIKSTILNFSISRNLLTDYDSYNLNDKLISRIESLINQKFGNPEILHKELVKNKTYPVFIIAYKLKSNRSGFEIKTTKMEAYFIVNNYLVQAELFQRNYDDDKLYLEIIENLKNIKLNGKQLD